LYIDLINASSMRTIEAAVVIESAPASTAASPLGSAAPPDQVIEATLAPGLGGTRMRGPIQLVSACRFHNQDLPPDSATCHLYFS
jgi:hypothetical protein